MVQNSSEEAHENSIMQSNNLSVWLRKEKWVLKDTGFTYKNNDEALCWIYLDQSYIQNNINLRNCL